MFLIDSVAVKTHAAYRKILKCKNKLTQFHDHPHRITDQQFFYRVKEMYWPRTPI